MTEENKSARPDSINQRGKSGTQKNKKTPQTPITTADAYSENNDSCDSPIPPSSDPIGTIMNDSEKTEQPHTEAVIENKRRGISKLSLLALLISAAAGTGLYFTHQAQTLNADKQNAAITRLTSEIATMQQATSPQSQAEQQQQSQRITELEKSLTQKLTQQNAVQKSLADELNNSIMTQGQSVRALQDKLASVSKTDTQTWLISQADYLVKLAGRKIWQDNDYVTAKMLLLSADSSLAEANDPSLLPARRAIIEDINKIAGMTQVDVDGITLKLTQLANDVSFLKLSEQQNNLTIKPLAEQSETVSDSPTDWKHNLKRNINAFFSKFVTFKKHENFADCLSQQPDETMRQACYTLRGSLAPEQQTYLRENIRLQLLIAAQALARNHAETYQQSLKNTTLWVNAYFDKQFAETAAFLSELNQLSTYPIITNQATPTQLNSAPIIDSLMQTRVRSLLAQPIKQGE